MSRLHTGRFRDLEPLFVRAVRTAKEGNPWAPVLAIVPSNAVIERLSEVLVGDRGAVLNVRFLTLLDLAREAAGEAVPEVMDPLEKDFLLEAVLEEIRGERGDGVLATPGFRRAVASTLRDLKNARVGAGDLAAWVASRKRPPRRLEVLARAFEGYEARCGKIGLADAEDLLAAAIPRVGECRPVARAGAVLLYGFYDLTVLQRDLVEAVLRARDTEAFLPVVPGRPGSGYAAETLAWFSDLSRLRKPESAPGSPGSDDPEGPEDIRIFEAAGPAREAEEAVREVLRLHGSGIPWNRIAILHRSPGDLRAPLAQALEEAGIPHRFRYPESLAEHPVAVAAGACYRALADGLPWPETTEFLMSPYAGGDRARLLESLVKEAGIVGGEGTLAEAVKEWGSGFRGLTNELERTARNTAKNDEASEGQKAAVRERADRAREIREGVLREFLDAAGAIPDSGAPSRFVEATLSALERLMRLPPDATRDENDALEAVRETVAGLRGLDRVRPRMEAGDFYRMALGALGGGSFRAREPRADVVRVLDVMGARGLSFDAVVLLGMIEKVFPRSVREDVLLRDAERRELAERTGRSVPAKARGTEEERLLFSLALESAERHVVLGRQRSDAGGRLLVRSWYLHELETAGRLRGGSRATMLSRFREAERAENRQWMLPAEARVLAIHRAFREKGKEGVPWLARSPGLLRAFRAEEERNDWERLTPFDGTLGPSPNLAIAGKTLSPTRVESYNRCAFQYFAGNVLGLEPPAGHAALEEMDALERGSFFHEIVEKGYRSLLEKALLPITEANREQAAGVLREVCREELEGKPPVGLPLLWEKMKEEFRGAIEALVEWEIRNPGYTPAFLEAKFAGLEIPLPSGETLLFRGRLDRVDLAPDRSAARVIDYKSSVRKADGKIVVGDGNRIQPTLYAWAMEEGALLDAEGRPVPATPVGETLLLHPFSKGGACEQRPDLLGEEARQALVPILASAARRIREGLFPPRPGSHCDWCDFEGVCRKDPVARSESKLAGGGLAGVTDGAPEPKPARTGRGRR